MDDPIWDHPQNPQYRIIESNPCKASDQAGDLKLMFTFRVF